MMVAFERMTLPDTTSQMHIDAEKYIQTNDLEKPTNKFTQDGCSLFFDTIPSHDFRNACLNHDIKYWSGGSEKERKEADLALREEIKTTGPLGKLLAPIMYTGVRLFGDSPVTKAVGANWGYGWNL